jgi:PKD repeat protein
MIKYFKSFSSLILITATLSSTLFISNCRKDENDPQASFTVSNLTPTIDEAVTFTNTSTNAHHVKWTFPDGTTASSNSVSYSFYPNGIYTVKLEAFNKNETYSDWTQQDISVCISGKAVFYMDSASFKSPVDITFNGAFAGSLTTYTNGTPNCGQSGAVTGEICPGTYTYEAKDADNKVWKNSVRITANNCSAIKLN